VIAAPTSIPRRRRGLRSGSGSVLRAVCGHSTSVRSGIATGFGCGTGETVGINLALGEAAASGFAVGWANGFDCRIQPVRPKNFAM